MFYERKKKNTIEQYGKGDGRDEHRWHTACRMSQETDNPVYRCFKALVSLEDKGLVHIVEAKKNH